MKKERLNKRLYKAIKNGNLEKAKLLLEDNPGKLTK